MNNNETNSVMNVDDYENMAVQKSNNAKRIAAGSALFVGGAAVAGGVAYAATGNENPEDLDNSPLTAEDVVDGGNVGNDYQPEVHNDTTTERVVYVERQDETPQDQHAEQTDETTVTWDEKTVIYDENGNVAGSVESGTVEGHNFALFDVDGDDHADYLAIDADENGQFDDNEIVKYDVSDHVHMGHETAHVKEIHYQNQYDVTDNDHGDIAQNDDNTVIHNNFEDEKTGESYYGDYAENNRDYNPNADMDQYGNSDNYLAENDGYDNSDNDSYSADVNEQYMAENDSYDKEDAEPYEEDDDMDYSNDYAETDTDDSYDDMTGEDSLLG